MEENNEEPTKLPPLSTKQIRFVEEYCIDFNATAAAKRAGYSLKTAAVIGCENLIKPNIKKAIADKLNSLTMSAEEAMVRMTNFARGSIYPFLHVDDQNFMTIDLTTDEARDNLYMIREVKQTKKVLNDQLYDITTEIKIHDAKDAVAKFLQMHGKLVNKSEVDLMAGGEKLEKTVIMFGKGNQGNENSTQ